jgi:hypothetical protein
LIPILSKSIFYLTWTLQSYEIYKYKNLFVTYKGGNNHRDAHFYANRHMPKPAVHHPAPAAKHTAPAPAPHHGKPEVARKDKGHNTPNRQIALNTNGGHSRSGHFGGHR